MPVRNKITQEMIDEAVERISSGESLSKISKEMNVNQGVFGTKLKENGTPASVIKPKKKNLEDRKNCKKCGKDMCQWIIKKNGDLGPEKTFCSVECGRSTNSNATTTKKCYICEEEFTSYSNAGMFCHDCVLGNNKKDIIFMPKSIRPSTKKTIEEYSAHENEHEKVLSFLGILHKEYGNYPLFECECKHCGNIHKRTVDNIKKEFKTCPKCPILHSGHKEITNKIWKGYVSGAAYRGYDFLVTAKYAWTLFENQERRCVFSGAELVFGTGKETTASLDRIDSSKGYIKGNLQWAHKDINRLKNNLTEEKFLEMIKSIYEYRILNASK